MKMEARYLEQEGSVREALALYQDILVQLEPKPLSEQMLPFYVKVGELARRTGDAGLARSTLIKGADRFAKAGDPSSVGELCLNILRVDPGHKDVYAQYARRMLDYGHVEPARQLLLDYAKRARSENLGKVLGQMERWPKKDLQRLLSDFLDRIVPEERRRRRSSDHRRRPSAAIRDADSDVELDLSDTVSAEAVGDSISAIDADGPPKPVAMPEEREAAQGNAEATEEHPAPTSDAQTPVAEPLDVKPDVPDEDVTGDTMATEPAAADRESEPSDAMPDAGDGDVPDDPLAMEPVAADEEPEPRLEAVDHDEGAGEQGALEPAPPLKPIEHDEAEDEPGTAETEDDVEVEEAAPTMAPADEEDAAATTSVAAQPVTTPPVVDAPIFEADEQTAEVPAPTTPPAIDEVDGAEPETGGDPAADQPAPASAQFARSNLRYLVPVGLAAAAGILLLAVDPFGSASEPEADEGGQPTVVVIRETPTETPSEQEEISTASGTEPVSPAPSPPPPAEQAAEADTPADTSTSEPPPIPAAQPIATQPTTEVAAAEAEEQLPPPAAAVTAATDSQPAGAEEHTVVIPPASEDPAPATLPEGVVLDEPTVVVEDAPIIEVAPFDAPAGQGYRILQLVGDADTLALTVVPLDEGTASQVGAGRVRVREADGSSIGTTRFGRYLVTGRAALPAPEVEALLQRLIEITPE
jgi:hypothetical protein